MRSKESGKVRYAYGVAMALLLGGTAFSIASGPVGAQVAQNAPGVDVAAPRRADVVRRPRRAGCSRRWSTSRPSSASRSPPSRPIRSRNSSAASARRRGRKAAGGRAARTPRTREAGSLGSGFIISPDGYIVTNNHLVPGVNGTGTVDTVTVTLTNRKEYTARIVGRDQTSDLALLKIEGSQPAVRHISATAPAAGSATG